MKEEIKQALECCAEFICDECPYKKYDTDMETYPLKCSHRLIMDLYKELKGIDGYD